MFISDESSTGQRAPVAVDPPRAMAPSTLLDPAYVVASVWRARWWIGFLTVVGAGLAVGYAVTTPKRYVAAAQLILDPRDLNIVKNELTPNGTSSSEASLALIQSQIAVATSNSVLERVVTQGKLTADPEFNGTEKGLLARFLPELSALMPGTPDEGVRDRQLFTMTQLRRKLDVSRDANSFVLNIAVDSREADKAARLANLVADMFIAEQGRVQADTARRATVALSSRLAELRQRVVDAESEVERYKAVNRLVGVGGKLVDDEYILRINNQLADVRGQITTLNVKAASMKAASVEDVVKGTLPEELSSEALARLRQAYSERAQNHAILAARLGPRHPQRIASEQALDSSRAAIAQELARIVSAAQTELSRARQTEKDLTAQIDTLKGQQIETSGAFVKLRELERDVDASRAVYEAYLLRARETSEQESLNTANIRVISEATPPLQPTSLASRVIVALGAAAGFGFGIGLVMLLAVLRLIARMASGAPARPTREERKAHKRAAAAARVEAKRPEVSRDVAQREETGLAALRPALFSEPSELREAQAPVVAETAPAPETASHLEAEPEATPEPMIEPTADWGDVAPDAEPADGRGDRLRQRLRDMERRRTLGAPALDADPETGEGSAVPSRRDLLAAMRQRRAERQALGEAPAIAVPS